MNSSVTFIKVPIADEGYHLTMYRNTHPIVSAVVHTGTEAMKAKIVEGTIYMVTYKAPWSTGSRTILHTGSVDNPDRPYVPAFPTEDDLRQFFIRQWRQWLKQLSLAEL